MELFVKVIFWLQVISVVANAFAYAALKKGTNFIYMLSGLGFSVWAGLLLWG